MLTFYRFETRYWLRGMMVWVFFLIVGALFFGAFSSDKVVIGGALPNTNRNAPFVIESMYGAGSLLTLLMVTAFLNSAAARDFQYNTYQILFSTPMKKLHFLGGRFLGAATIALIPMLSISVAVILAKFMPWVDPDRWGPIYWSAHLNGILVFAIPNTIFISAIIFTIAALTRSTVVSFLGSIFLLIGYSISQILLRDIKNEKWAILLDPFGLSPFSLSVKYWTVSDRNTLSVPLAGDILLNRIIWVSVGLAIFAFACYRFRFEERSGKPKKRTEEDTTAAPAKVIVPPASLDHSSSAQWSQFFSQTSIEFWGLVKSTSFIVIVAGALLNTLPSLILSNTEGFGTSSLPVTYRILDIIRGSLYIFLISIITYFAGVLVWRERDSRADEIHDALPYPNWIPYVAKFCALLGALAIILAVSMLMGIGVQAWNHYTRFQLGFYVNELFVLDLLAFTYVTFLAFLIHVLSPNKYLGYFIFIALLIANEFVWRPLDVASKMVDFGSVPSHVYSDLYHYAPFVKAITWFHIYWLLFCLMLGAATVLLWPRGKETSLFSRFNGASLSFQGTLRLVTLLLAVSWVASAGWVLYNTKFLNKYLTENETNRRRSDYEKQYKKYEGINQPRIQSVKYWIDVYPAERNLTLKAEQVIRNTGQAPISELHLNLTPQYDTTVDIDTAKMKQDDTRLLYRIYELNPPLAPGAELNMKFTVKAITKGFEQSLSHSSLVQNGTFFNNGIAPQIGYQGGNEMTDRNERKKYGLKEKDLMPELERNCTAHCANTYLSNNSDWVPVETIMSTSPDQMAIAPGSLLRQWNENGRAYYHYKLDHDSLNFYSFISARYEVARDEFQGVKAEVYYHPEHKWNVPKMLDSIKKTIQYCTANFGPYAHKQARIIEFPRFASFAQAFPGTMPYSEGIGFIANLKDPEDIDNVFYIVAHEMGHQWWAHQVVGANMQGATLLSETLAQYTALMVMEKQYGRDIMRKFLAYEMDNYLRSRGAERLKERPLYRVEASQGYTHYRKGSVILYYLKEMIGEDKVNQALHNVIEKWAYKGPPYPTSYVLLDAFREVTPPDKQYLIQDLFEDITLFGNRTLLATAKKRPDGKYDVTIEVEAKKFKADEKGLEKEVPVNDWIDIGAFAKPPKGKKYGATLHRERIHITSPKNKFTFTVDSEPEKAGIDPFSLLIDRIRDDNMKNVTISD